LLATPHHKSRTQQPHPSNIPATHHLSFNFFC
jgi:hypothetical protein